jgi:hypothetical protein
MQARADGLALELERLDRLLHRESLRLRARYELSLDELRGLYVTDEQVDRLLAVRASEADDASIAELAAEAEAIDALLGADGSPLRALAAELGLGAFERDALLLGLAPEIDLKYETVVAYLNNDVTRKWPTPDLALRAFAVDRRSARAAMSRGAPLFESGALEPVASDKPLASLAESYRASPIVARQLFGLPLAAALDGSAVIVDGAALDRIHEELRQRLLRMAPWLAQRAARPLLVLEGDGGSGRLATSACIAALLGRGLLRVDAARLGGDETALRRIQLVATLEQRGVHLAGWSPAIGEAARALADAGVWPISIAVEADDAWRAGLRGRAILHLEIGIPPAAQRRALWSAQLAREGVHASDAALDEVADRFAVAPGVIADAARAAAANHALDAPSAPASPALLMDATKEQLDRGLGKLAVKEACNRGWDDLVLPRATLERVRDIVGAIRFRTRVYAEWGFERHLGHRVGLAALFAGPSGTGKTMTAGIIAADVGLDLYRIELSGVVSKYIGETEKNLDKIFAAARSANAILFFDEADALFGKRSEVKDAHDRYANVEVAYLLQKLESHPGVVILATNLARNLDAAFSRRLHYVVEFPKPDEPQRHQLWLRMLDRATTPLADDVDLDFLAKHFDAPGGDIRTVALDAAFSAAGADRAIEMADLVHAMARQLRKSGRMPAAGNFKQYLSLVTKGRS